MGNDFFAKKPLVHKRPKLAYFKVNEPEKNFVSHDSPEILFVAGGSGRIDVFGGQYPLRSGDVIVISKTSNIRYTCSNRTMQNFMLSD